MMGLKLNHVSKWGPWGLLYWNIQIEMPEFQVDGILTRLGVRPSIYAILTDS